MEKIATPGVIFKFDDDEDYVYLAYSASDNILYCAKILDLEISAHLAKKRDGDDKAMRHNPKNDVSYCFVILTTHDFEGRVAHFGITARNEVKISTIYDKLNTKDWEGLRDAIMNSSAAPDLKKRLKATTK